MGAVSDPVRDVDARTAVDVLEFRVLGPLEIRVGGHALHIGGHRRRVVLLMLLLEPGRIIPVDRLIHAVWDGSPPRTAETQVQICVSQLRSLLAEASDVDLIRTHPVGYAIQPPDGALDMVRFGQLAAAGRALAAQGEVAAAAVRLRAALDLWRGEVAADVTSRLAQAAAVRLNEERLAVLQEWIGLELELGRHAEHIGTLTELVTAYPLREKLHAQLVLALYRAGRQAEALAACRQARRLLVEEHGIDPGEELRRLERAILENDPELNVPAREPALIVPRQLPAPPSDFVGRVDAVAHLGRLMVPPEAANDRRRGVPVVSVGGAAGVGKSALAVQLAYHVQPAFPDGQLYAHLRGTDAVPVPPELVLNQFLRALGIPPATLPSDLAELAALYRSRIADHRILVVLDDAASESQVRPLIPGDPRCALVVTSRYGLPGLPGAHRLNLDVLDPATSLALLSQVIGEARVRAEPEAAAALTEACGHLPLALQVAAAKLSVKSHWRVAQMARRLADERRRLDELTLDDVGVRPSISISYRALEPPADRLLLLLGALGAAEFAGWVAGPLLDVDSLDGADVLDQLIEARLVEVQTGAGQRTRYRLHDLTRIFARELLADEVPAAERIAAQHRLLRCWLFLASEAHRREFGGDHMVLHSAEAAPWSLPSDVIDELLADPMQWLQSEYGNLVAAVSLAAQLGLDDVCWDLAVTSVTLFETRAYYDAWRDTHEVAMEAVQRTGNRRGEAVLRYSRGGLALAEKRLDDARSDFERAVAWFASAGDAHGHGLTLRNLAAIDRTQGGYDAALAQAEAALADLRSVGDRVAEASALRILAQVLLECHRTDEAELRLREALVACTDAGVRRIDAQNRYWLGEVLLAKGELAEAEQMFAVVLAAAEQLGDEVGRASALLGAGNVHLGRGELPQAESALGAALAAARSGTNRLLEGRASLAMAELRLHTDDPSPAADELSRAEAIFHEIGASAWLARAAGLRDRLAGRRSG